MVNMAESRTLLGELQTREQDRIGQGMSQRNSGKIHYAKLSDSPRLQRVLKALEDAGMVGLTTREIILKAEVCAVNTAIAELRSNGIKILCKPQGHSPSGANVYRYMLGYL